MQPGGWVVVNKTAYEYMTNLQYKVADLTEQIQSFKSGEKYLRLEKYREDCICAKDREIKKLKIELAEVRVQYTDVRNNWLEVIEDMEKEHAKALNQKDCIIDTLKQQLWNAQNTINGQKEKFLAQKKELYQVLTELEDEKGKVLNLKAQINRDYENSGIPSSMKPNRKKITNNREKTGRKPGGQPGHKGHRRRKYTPTRTLEIPPLEIYLKPN
jgi:chromosome segregation ATPase